MLHAFFHTVIFRAGMHICKGCNVVLLWVLTTFTVPYVLQWEDLLSLWAALEVSVNFVWGSLGGVSKVCTRPQLQHFYRNAIANLAIRVLSHA